MISVEDAEKRTAEILDTLSITNVFRPGKDLRENADIYLRRILMRARLSPFESDWVKRMSMRLRYHLKSLKDK